jgi:hypothetical protein
MKLQCTLLAAFAALFACSVAVAGPRVLEQQARILLPDATYSPVSVAVDGSSIIVVGDRPIDDPDRPFIVAERAAFLFERTSAGTWAFVRMLVHVEHDSLADTGDYMSVGMQGGLAAVAAGAVHVFERSASGWVGTLLSGGGDGVDVEVASGMILASSGYCGYDGDLHQKDASGAWTSKLLIGQRKEGCDDELRGSDVDLSSNRAILDAPGELYIFNRNTDGSWPTTATAIVSKPALPLNVFSSVAIEGDYALTNGTQQSGLLVIRNNGGWAHAGNFWRADSLVVGNPSGLEMLSGLTPVGYPLDPLRGDSSGSVAVFRRNSSGGFDYVAKLLASDATSNTRLGTDVEISGRRIAVASNDAIYVYDLPATLDQPAIVQDNFEDGNASEWATLAGSSFSVVSNGLTRVYRQSSTAGDAAATRGDLDRTDQAIEVIATPRSFAGNGEKWFGLTARQTDPGNFYYLTVRSTNVVQLRKLQNGVITVLASSSLPVTLNRAYRLRLEAVGTWIRGYVDGQLRVQARDALHKHGTPGVRMYRAATDYDDVAITPNPQITLFRDDFNDDPAQPWTTHNGTWSEVADGSQVFAQTSLTGDGRVTSGVPADDQAIQVRAKANTFAAGGERWFGVMARFRDERNFYYVTVRNTNQLSLRKLVNGTIFVLDTAPLPVSTGRWYSLRLEAVGSSLRAYVDGRLLAEASDTSHTTGTYGLATYGTSAHFDDVVATQP